MGSATRKLSVHLISICCVCEPCARGWVFSSEQGIWKDPNKEEGLTKLRGPLSQGGNMCSRKSLGFRRGCHGYRFLFERVWSRSHPLELKGEAGRTVRRQMSWRQWRWTDV